MTVTNINADRCRRRRGGGFTLVELVAVIVVVAIVSAAVIPSLDSFDTTRGALATRHLRRDVSFARQRAIATGIRTWVVFDVNAETWSVLVEDPANPGRGNATVLTDPATGEPFVESLGSGVFVGVGIQSAFFDGAPEVGFDWLGRSLATTETPLAADGSVVLTGGEQVQVRAGTGYVTLAIP